MSDLCRAVAESVKKAIECPVCQGTVRIPFKQCYEGHIACSECVKPLGHCPICDDPDLIENPEKELNLLIALPKLCRHSRQCCEIIFGTNEDLEDHETLCNYRPASCRELGCKEVVPLIKLIDHYRLKHKEHFVCMRIMQRMIEVSFDSNVKGVIYTFIQYGTVTFKWIVSRNNYEKKQIEFKVLGIRSDRFIYDFWVKMSIGDGLPYLYVYSFPPTEMNALKDLEKDENDEFEDQFCMRVPHEAVKRLADDKGKLKFNIYFYVNN